MKHAMFRQALGVMVVILSIWSGTATGLSLDWRDVCFESGRPTDGEHLLSAIEPSFNTQMENLDINLELLATYPDARFNVIGHASSLDCLDGGCVEMSLRRAELVHAYLLAQGVPSAQLNAPIGVGTMQPRALDETDSGQNQCVELAVTLDPKPVP